MSQLPQGWKEIEIGSVAKVISGGTPKASDSANFSEPGTGHAWLTPADLSGYKCKSIAFGRRDLSQQGLGSSSAKLMPKGSVLFSSRAPIGYVAVAENEISTNQGFKSFVFGEDVDSSYAYYYLKSIRSLAESWGTGTTFKELSTTKAKQLPFILAPLEDQKRIADKLDSVLAKVEAAQVRLDKIPTILKRFRQSVLAAATSGELTRDWREENESIQSAFEAYELKRLSDRKKWEEIKLSEFREKNKFPSNDKWKAKYKEVALPNQEELQPLNSGWGYFYVENVASSAKYSMSSGPFGSALGRKDYTEAGVPVLRGQNVKNGVAGVGGFVFVSEEKATSIPRSLAYPGDVVVVAVGSSGVTGIIPQNISVALLSQNCNKISVDNVLVRSEYFNLFLQSQVAQSQISAQTTDTVRQFFSLTNLKKTVIAVPPLQEQNEILLRVEELFEHANTVEKQYNAAKARLDKLIQSILAKAFRGELVTS